MKTIQLLILSILMITAVSCSKEDTSTINECEFNDEVTAVEPVCAFNPRTLPTVPFPIFVTLNEERLPFEGYTYLWSSGSVASAVSSTFEGLPISVTVTEASTGCEAVLQLDQSYWP